MMITIVIKISDLIDAINLRTYYIGESLKQKDIACSSIQSSSDNADELETYIGTAFNDICGRLVKRVKDFSVIDDDELKFEFEPYERVPDNSDKVIDLLKGAIKDYIVEYASFQWIKILRPDISQSYSSNLPDFMNKVDKYIQMLSGLVRRKYNFFGV